MHKNENNVFSTGSLSARPAFHHVYKTLRFFCFVLLVKDLVAIQEYQHDGKKDDQNRQRDVCHLHRLCDDTQEKQHRSAENDGPQILQDHVACGGRLVQRVDLTEQDQTGTDRASQHAIHNEELLAGIILEEFPGDETDIEETDQTAGDGDEDQRQPEFRITEG